MFHLQFVQSCCNHIISNIILLKTLSNFILIYFLPLWIINYNTFNYRWYNNQYYSTYFIYYYVIIYYIIIMSRSSNINIFYFFFIFIIYLYLLKVCKSFWIAQYSLVLRLLWFLLMLLLFARAYFCSYQIRHTVCNTEL